jgi:hypothetical protein
VAGTRPAGNGRPSNRDLQNFLDLPGGGRGSVGGGVGSNRLGNAAAGFGGALAGGAAAEFLQNRPSQLPARPGLGEGGRPDLRRPGQPGTRPDNSLPGAGNRPDLGRPGQPDLGRPGRPDIGQPGRPDLGQPGRPDLGQPGRPDLGQPGRPDLGQPGRPDFGQPGRPDLGRPGRPGDYVQNLPSRIGDWNQWQNWRQNAISNVGDYWQNNWGNYGNWYGDSWWANNGLNWPYYPGFGYWAAAAWSGLTGWVDSGWTEPVYYNYGDNVYYDDGSVYYGDQPVCTEAQYIEQAEAIAASVPEAQPAAQDWLPLGVFALTKDGEPTGADPTMFLQLAVSKQGVISGTFQNTATNAVKAVEGMVDKQTQRAAWTAAGETRPLMETGIVNLTQDSTAALVHFPDDSTQQILLVRLEKPGTQKASTSAASK